MRTCDFCDIPVKDATELQHKVGQTNLNGHLKNNWLVIFKSIKIMKVRKTKQKPHQNNNKKPRENISDQRLKDMTFKYMC